MIEYKNSLGRMSRFGIEPDGMLFITKWSAYHWAFQEYVDRRFPRLGRLISIRNSDETDQWTNRLMERTIGKALYILEQRAERRI